MPRVTSLDKSLDVLEAVFASPHGIGTRALAKRLDLNVATVHNIATTLASRGYLRQDSVTKAFVPGHRFALFAHHPAVDLALLARLAAGVVDDVAEKLNESVMLAAVEYGRIINLKYVSSTQALRVHEPDDVTDISYCTAVGKILLAAMKTEQFDEYLSVTKFTQFTPRTLATPNALRAEIEAIRRNGYARTIDELNDGISAIAVPIIAPWSAIIAGVGASAPTVRLHDPVQIAESLAELHAAAEKIGALWCG